MIGFHKISLSVSASLKNKVIKFFNRELKQRLHEFTPEALNFEVTPTVMYETRLQFERLSQEGELWKGPLAFHRQEGEFTQYKTFSNNMTDCFQSLVTIETFKSKVSLGALSGCYASKSFSNYINPIQYRTMAEWGQHVTDLQDLQGLDDDEVIKKCAAYPEARFDEELSIITDNWHGRNYWMNSGGSHHTAVLSYTLAAKNQVLEFPAKFTRYHFDLETLMKIEQHSHVYVYRANRYRLDPLSSSIPSKLVNKIPYMYRIIKLSTFAPALVILVIPKCDHPLALLLRERMMHLLQEQRALGFSRLINNVTQKWAKPSLNEALLHFEHTSEHSKHNHCWLINVQKVFRTKHKMVKD